MCAAGWRAAFGSPAQAKTYTSHIPVSTCSQCCYMCVMLMAQFAAFAQHSWPYRVSKIIQDVNCPVVAPLSVLLSRAGAAPSTSESQENGFRKPSGGKGWGESHLQPGRRAGRAAEERSAGAGSSALATLPKQLPPGLELPPLCKHRHQHPL